MTRGRTYYMLAAVALGRALAGLSVDMWSWRTGGTDAIFFGFFAVFSLAIGAPGYGYMAWAARKNKLPNKYLGTVLSAPELVVIVPVLAYSLVATLVFGLDALKLNLYVIWLAPAALATVVVALSMHRGEGPSSSTADG